jgi:hydroxymethylpyrimidine/phosphomethylpyrimidine kinase
VALGGLDPCGGAGILADVKTGEAHGVRTMAVCTALTSQTESHFKSLSWVSRAVIMDQLETLLKHYTFSAAKFGIVESLETLVLAARTLREYCPNIKIVWDPVIKATAGYAFHKGVFSESELNEVLALVDVVTPNQKELCALLTDKFVDAEALSSVTGVIVTGGNTSGETTTDMLYCKGKVSSFQHKLNSQYDKHGSGCVFSTSLAARLGLGDSLDEATKRASDYTTAFIFSTSSLLGTHDKSLLEAIV